MLRTVSKGSSRRRNMVAGVCNQLPSHQLFFETFSTWLNAHHLPQHLPSRSELEGPSTSNISAWGHHARRFNSVRHSYRQHSSKEAEVAQLSRFLRRQQQFQPKATAPGSVKGKRSEPNPAPTTFRSRHYDFLKEVPKTAMKPLEPHVLSARLKRSCEEGKVDDAVFMLKNAPLDAQNTQVWNTLIWECLKVKRYQLAYQLFVDVSTPSTITQNSLT